MNVVYTSREQVQVYKFSLPITVGVPLLALFFQSFVSVHFSWLMLFDLPLLVTIYFAVARRNPIKGMLTGSLIGLVQDSLTHLPIGLFGIAKTVVGYLASSIGVKIDVENPGSRVLMTVVFYTLHQTIYILIARGMLSQTMGINWSRLLIAAVANAIVAVPLFSVLDRLKTRV